MATKKNQNKDCFKCLKCGMDKETRNFYTSYDSRMAEGYIPYCKTCLQNSVIDEKGNINETKVKQTLKLINRPFIQDLWDRTKRDTKKNIFGVYMKNIALPQNRRLTWDDSVYEGFVASPSIMDSNEKIYSEEWLGYYTQVEIDYLDNYLKGLRNDFKIVTTNHIDYAKKIAQASLAVNKAYQDMLNGVAGADKKYKDLQGTFDTLSKSAQFAENTRGINDVSLGCFGVIFDKVEKRTYIYEHQPEDKDMYDKLLEQFSNINKSL